MTKLFSPLELLVFTYGKSSQVLYFNLDESYTILVISLTKLLIMISQIETFMNQTNQIWKNPKIWTLAIAETFSVSDNFYLFPALLLQWNQSLNGLYHH